MTMAIKSAGPPRGKPKKPTAAELAEEEIRSAPIRYAYALVPVEGSSGLFRYVLLHGVTGYDRIEFLKDDCRPGKPVYGIDRIKQDIEVKRRKGEFEWPASAK